MLFPEPVPVLRAPSRVRGVFLALFPALLALGAWGCAAQEADDTGTAYEIWSLDQGTHHLHVHDAALEEVHAADLSAHAVTAPHMIDFTSDHAYAFVAGLTSGNVAVIRTEDREVLGVVETGHMTHMASVAPDDRTVLAAVMGHEDPWDGELVELRFEPGAGTVEVGRRFRIAEDPMFAERRSEFNRSSPVCMDYTSDGRYAYVTLGPALGDGGLVVLDMEAWALAAVHPPSEVRANCGTLRSPTGDHMFVNGGSGTVGVWYVLDARAHQVVHEAESRGMDAHGVWAAPDGREVWMLNRVTGNLIIIDPASFEVVDEIEYLGRAPDIIAMAPDSDRAFITLRGPNPVTAAHVAVGDTPGFAVVDIPNRTVLDVVQPAADNPASDFHGIGVRAIRR